MNVIKLAAFSDKQSGGNPAGVALVSALPSPAKMQQTAADVGFSETVFAQMLGDKDHWRVRYFSPESEVAFCGHATIALGSTLAEKYGNGTYHLTLNETTITVEGISDSSHSLAALQSPPTHHSILSDDEISSTLELFSYKKNQISSEIPPAKIHAGADHYVIALKSRADLSAMNYDLQEGREFMRSRKLVTIMFVVAAPNNVFHVRNAFASGGVFEDPATGAAAAAFSGYLRDTQQSSDQINIIQGEDMGERSLIKCQFTQKLGSSIRVSGTSRTLG